MSRVHRPWILPASVLACAVLIAGCRNKDEGGSASDAGVRVAASAPPVASPAVTDDARATGQPKGGHDPSHPPIGCPLRKQGVDLNRLRLFEDVEEYAAFLERTDRAAWQKPDEVIRALGLEGTETVADLGAGSGYFTFRCAKALPAGRVVAADTEAEMIRHIHHKAMADGVQNVEAKLIQPGDPAVPAQADLVFVCDVLHYVADRSAWLAKLAADMKPGIRLVLIEFKEGNLPEGSPAAAKIIRAQILELVTQAGLRLASERADLLPYQTFLVFRKPGITDAANVNREGGFAAGNAPRPRPAPPGPSHPARGSYSLPPLSLSIAYRHAVQLQPVTSMLGGPWGLCTLGLALLRRAGLRGDVPWSGQDVRRLPAARLGPLQPRRGPDRPLS